MGIYLPDMEMPKPGEVIRIYNNGEARRCRVTEQKAFEVGIAFPVPPHGRLIDADAFIANQRHLYCENCERRKGMKNGKMKFVYSIGDAPCRACDVDDMLDSIEDYTPTIIPAEEGE